MVKLKLGSLTGIGAVIFSMEQTSAEGIATTIRRYESKNCTVYSCLLYNVYKQRGGKTPLRKPLNRRTNTNELATLLQINKARRHVTPRPAGLVDFIPLRPCAYSQTTFVIMIP